MREKCSRNREVGDRLAARWVMVVRPASVDEMIARGTLGGVVWRGVAFC